MTKDLFKALQASGRKLACIQANEKVTTYWISQLDDSKVKFVEFFGFSDDEHIAYAAFSVEDDMTKKQFHELINMECDSFILTDKGPRNW